MTGQGKANYEGYREFSHGKSLVSGAEIPEWDGVPVHIQSAWDAGADAVELWLSQLPADEDAPGNEPKPAKVIIVTEAGGREVRYSADWIDSDGAGLNVNRDHDEDAFTVAHYAPGYYKRAYREDVLLGDDVTRLGIARAALREIAAGDEDDAAARARQALEDIADVDL